MRPWNEANKTDAGLEVKMKAGQQMSGAHAHAHSITPAHLQLRWGGAPLNDAAGYNIKVELGCN